MLWNHFHKSLCKRAKGNDNQPPLFQLWHSSFLWLLADHQETWDLRYKPDFTSQRQGESERIKAKGAAWVVGMVEAAHSSVSISRDSGYDSPLWSAPKHHRLLAKFSRAGTCQISRLPTPPQGPSQSSLPKWGGGGKHLKSLASDSGLATCRLWTI